MSDSDSEEVSLETQFELQEDDELFEVIEIIGERKNEYRVRWAGNDPKTKKPWQPSWVPKHDCTDDLVISWKKLQRKKKEERTRAKEAKKTVKGKSKEKERTRKESSEKSSRTTRSSNTVSSPAFVLPGKVGPPRLHKRKRVAAAAIEDELQDSQDEEEQFANSNKPGPSRRTKRPRIESSYDRPKPSSRAYIGDRSDSSDSSQEIPYPQHDPDEDKPPEEHITPARAKSRSRTRERSKDRVGARSPEESESEEVEEAPVIEKRRPAKVKQQKRATSSERQPPVVPAKKVLRPVPVVSPSAFRPYLPAPPVPLTQDTIEEFSSPERPPKAQPSRTLAKKASKLPLHGKGLTIVPNGKKPAVLPDYESDRSKHSPEKDAEAVARTMEEDYIDMTGGFSSPTHEVEEIDTSGSTNEQPHAIQGNGEGIHDNIAVCNVTTSTQEAVADSQSQPWAGISQELDSPNQQDSQIIKLRAELQSSNETFALIQNDLRVRDEELSEAKALLKVRDNTLAQSRTQVRMQGETIASLQREVKQLRAREAETKAELTAVITKQDQLITQIDDYRAQNEDLLAARTELQGEVGDLCEEVLALRQRNRLGDNHPDSEESDEGYSDSGSADIAAHRQSATVSLLDKLQLSEKRVAELEAQASAWRTDALSSIRKTFGEHVQRLEGEVAQWRGLYGILRNKDERTDDDIRRRAGEEPELRRKLENLGREHAELQTEHEKLQSESSELEKECDKLHEERVQWLTEKEEWVDEVQDLTHQKEALQQEKCVWEEDRLRLQDALETRAAEKAVREKKIAALTTSIEELRATLSNAEADNASLKLLIRKTEDEKAQAAAQLQQTVDELGSLKTDNEALRTQLTASKTDSDALRAQLDVSRTEDAASQSKFLALREEHLALQTEEASLKVQLDLFRERTTTLERDLDGTREERSRILEEHKTQIDTVTSSLLRVQGELEHLGGEIRRTKEERDELGSELERFNTQRQELAGSIRHLVLYKEKINDMRQPPPPSEADEAWFVCTWTLDGGCCGRRFSSKTDLKSHVHGDHLTD